MAKKRGWDEFFGVQMKSRVMILYHTWQRERNRARIVGSNRSCSGSGKYVPSLLFLD